ncbi:MAG: zinc dependent phospholipase C family protein [Candidatus Thorarchaeota archaeon]
MYFLAHLYVILQALPEVLKKEELFENLTPIVYGCWGPDLGYFPHYSPKLTIFEHAEKPQINLFRGENRKEEAFYKGWKIHMICDEIIHMEPFFENGDPVCPLIKRNEGLKIYLRTAREHLGREVGLDIFIYRELLNNDWRRKIINNKELYLERKINYPGFKKVQKYVYWYTTKFIPRVAKDEKIGKRIQKIIKYDFYSKEIEERIKEMLEKMILKSKEIMEK